MTSRRALPPLLLVVLLGAGLALWSRLPQVVPIHWNLAGTPDGWADRWVGVTAIPVVGILTWGILEVVRVVARRRSPAPAAVDRMVGAIQLTLAGFWWVLQGAALADYLDLPLPLDISGVALAGMGALLAAMGLFMIRESATEDGVALSNLPVDDVDTQRRGLRNSGRLLILSGAITALGAGSGAEVRLALLAVGFGVLAVLLPIYLIWLVARAPRRTY